ncbi:MFS transporter [Vibrio sp. DNF-1]|nr:MFS transporter [Vibrio salinus]
MHSLNINYQMASMIYTISLLGNLCSLLFITPLGDFTNRKKIIGILYLLLILSSFEGYLTKNIYMMYISAFFLGVGVAIIPITISYLSRKKEYGATYIGKIMSGVLLGALMSRFLSSEFAAHWGWHSIYLFSSVMMVMSLLFVLILMPNDSEAKENNLNYISIIMSTFSLMKSNRMVLKYSIYGFSVMAVFAAFWNNITANLYDNFHLSQTYIGLFSLTGVAGASVALFSDKILNKLNYSSKLLFSVMFLSFVFLILFPHNIIALCIGSVFIDAMIQLIHINNQTNMYKHCIGNESRAASCYMTAFIIGGIFGAKLSALLYILYGWSSICFICLAIIFVILLSLYSSIKTSTPQRNNV